MGLLRHRDDGPPAQRFQMRERLLSVGDDYWIEDGAGNRVFLVDGKALRLRNTWILKDAGGADVAEIKERKLTVRDKVTIDLGGRSAHVTKRIVGIRDHFKVDVDGESDLKVHGNIVDHEYEIERDGDQVAEVSKKWFRVRDTYGVEIAGGVDPVLILAVTAAVRSSTRCFTAARDCSRLAFSWPSVTETNTTSSAGWPTEASAPARAVPDAISRAVASSSGVPPRGTKVEASRGAISAIGIASATTSDVPCSRPRTPSGSVRPLDVGRPSPTRSP